MQRLNLVGEAVKVGGNLRFVSDAIIDIALECRKSDNPNVKSLLVSSLKNVDPSVLHFIRGTIATFEGNMDKAVQYLSLAAEDGSNLPGVLNNLAVALHSKEGSDLNEALRFSELALKQLPEHPYFLETRGQILFKLGRTQEAIRDLERALQAEEIANVVLPTLIECYKKLNLEEMVQQYQMQWDRLGEKR
jgi:tetratricopeptide (TPR) repeat protein